MSMAQSAPKLRGFKVTDSSRSKIVGVACHTLHELINKASQKLNLKNHLVVALEDGTLIQDDDYFQTVPAQTLFVLYKEDERIITGSEIILKALQSVNAHYLNVGAEAAQVLQAKADELSNLMKTFSNCSTVLGNDRKSDPDWFLGLESNATTKEDFMRCRAKERVRGYLYQFQDDVRKSKLYLQNEKARMALIDCISYLKARLAQDDHFACYFDRRCAPKDCTDSSSKRSKKFKAEEEVVLVKRDYKVESFCDATGKFDCEGLWKMNYCEFQQSHYINPYLNRESRVVFSTWNLDHRIEKSRTVVPAVLNALENLSHEVKLNADYLYKLLFTRFNLRLVHIACHDKRSHPVSCDESLLYIQNKNIAARIMSLMKILAESSAE